MRTQTNRHDHVFSTGRPPHPATVPPFQLSRPCHGCTLEHFVSLGCYGALFVLKGNTFRPGDHLVIEGLVEGGTESRASLAAEVVRSEDGAVAVAFERELPDTLMLRPPFRVVRLLPVCPLE